MTRDNVSAKGLLSIINPNFIFQNMKILENEIFKSAILSLKISTYVTLISAKKESQIELCCNNPLLFK